MAPKTGSKKKTSSKIKEAESRIEDIDPNVKYLKMCVYGRNGKGKTRFGASGPNPLIIDCDDEGEKGARKVKGAKVFRVNTWTDIDLIYWYLKKGKHDIKTVVIDTVTSLNALCLKFVLGDEASRDPTRDPQMPDKRMYGKTAQLLSTEILKFRSLPMNVIFLAQEKKSYIDEDDDDAMEEVFPSVQGKPKETLTAAVDIIGRMYTTNVAKKVKVKVKGKTRTKKVSTPEFRMLLAPHEVFTTKVNIEEHGLPNIVRNPTIPMLLKRINR